MGLQTFTILNNHMQKPSNWKTLRYDNCKTETKWKANMKIMSTIKIKNQKTFH